MTDFVDTIVAGGGTAGSAAAWQLARRGHEVLLLEAEPALPARIGEPAGCPFEPAHADPAYRALAAESVALWRDVEVATGASILVRSGSVVHGPAVRVDPLAAGLARARLDGEFLTVPQAEARWPGLRFSGSVLFVHQGGVLRHEAAITALRSAAGADGARIAAGETITRIRILGDDRVRLELRATDAPAVAAGAAATRELDCRRLVVTLGPATARLLRGLLALPRLTTSREDAIVVPMPGGSAPAVLHLADPTAPGNRYWRGDATVLGGTGELALGWRGIGRSRADAQITSTRAGSRSGSPDALSPRERAALLRYAREWLPGADLALPSVTSRVRTAVGDGGFLVDRIGPVVVGAGFGSAGAGLAPAVGRLLAGLVEGIGAPDGFSLRPERRRAGAGASGGRAAALGVRQA